MAPQTVAWIDHHYDRENAGPGRSRLARRPATALRPPLVARLEEVR